MLPVNTVSTIILGVGVTFGGLLGVSGLKDLRQPDHVRMELVTLVYQDGEFYQEHIVTGAEKVRADWAAKIVRDGHFLCVGGGTSLYANGGSPKMGPSFWTGDECPDLQPGDLASATWEYVDEQNIRRRIGAEIVIE
jgi:hypothetical protein